MGIIDLILETVYSGCRPEGVPFLYKNWHIFGMKEYRNVQNIKIDPFSCKIYYNTN